MNKSEHLYDSKRSTQPSAHIGKSPKFMVIEAKTKENSNIKNEVKTDFGEEMSRISKKINEAIRTNPYNFLEVIAK